MIGLANALRNFFARNLLGVIITSFTILETKLRGADVVDFPEYPEEQLKRKAGEQWGARHEKSDMDSFGLIA